MTNMIPRYKKNLFISSFLLLFAMASNLNGKTVLLEEADNGTRVVLNVGDTLSIKLKSNATTGYSWSASDLPSSLQLTGAKTVPGKAGRVGEPGFQTLTFKAVAPGDSTLQLNYARPFEKNSPPAKTFHVSISIENRLSSPAT